MTYALGHFFAQAYFDKKWVTRRTETVSFLGRAHYERRMTLDFEPAQLAEFAKEAELELARGAPILVDVLRNGIQLDIDVTDAQGSPLRLFTSSQSSLIATSIIAWIASHQRVLTEEERIAIYRYVSGRISELRIIGNLSRATADAVKYFRENYFLIAYPPPYSATEGILKLRIVESLHSGSQIRAEDTPSMFLWRVPQLTVQVPASNCGEVQREHLRIVCPRGLIAETANLVVDGNDDGIEDDDERRIRTMRRVTTDRATFYTRRVDPTGYYYALLTFAPKPTLSLISAVFASVGMALISIFIMVGEVVGNILSSSPHSSGVDVSAVSGILLLVPSVLTVLGVAAAEHELESIILRGPRVVLILSSAIYYFSVLALALNARPWLSIGMWVTSVALSVVSSISLALYWRRGVVARKIIDAASSITESTPIINAASS